MLMLCCLYESLAFLDDVYDVWLEQLTLPSVCKLDLTLNVPTHYCYSVELHMKYLRQFAQRLTRENSGSTSTKDKRTKKQFSNEGPGGILQHKRKV